MLDDRPNGTIACSSYVKRDYDAVGCMGTVRGSQRSANLIEKLSKSFVRSYSVFKQMERFTFLYACMHFVCVLQLMNCSVHIVVRTLYHSFLQVYVYESETEAPLTGLPAGVLPHAIVKLRVTDVKAMLELLEEIGLLTGGLDTFLAQLPSTRTSLLFYAQHQQSAFSCAHCQQGAASASESIADADQTSTANSNTNSAAAAASNRRHLCIILYIFMYT